ncbi:MAG: prepilin-type N-terminal cleavage/methylation domain-containing protein, partial [Chloroflexi bacterium]|nr:prepilin-type N-terminal cleavage/methylation domain-containing protein [Chloroflexota bacterium]
MRTRAGNTRIRFPMSWLKKAKFLLLRQQMGFTLIEVLVAVG